MITHMLGDRGGDYFLLKIFNTDFFRASAIFLLICMEYYLVTFVEVIPKLERSFIHTK